MEGAAGAVVQGLLTVNTPKLGLLVAVQESRFVTRFPPLHNMSADNASVWNVSEYGVTLADDTVSPALISRLSCTESWWDLLMAKIALQRTANVDSAA